MHSLTWTHSSTYSTDTFPYDDLLDLLLDPHVLLVVLTQAHDDPHISPSVLVGGISGRIDGASNVQAAGEVISAYFPHVSTVHGSEHLISLIFSDFAKIPAIRVSRSCYSLH